MAQGETTMTTPHTTPEQNTNVLIKRLAQIADHPANHVGGESRIKAAVMVAYLLGRPAPTEAYSDNSALVGFNALQQEFGIQLTPDGS
jgi:hypothetical protein